MYKVTFFVIAILFTYGCFAKSANCVIKIEDVNKKTSYKVEQSFNNKYEEDKGAQKKGFDIPGGDYDCTLAFFNLKTGTMLSCGYKKDAGETFFQSDRSALKEANSVNNLTFRHKSTFVSIKSTCK